MNAISNVSDIKALVAHIKSLFLNPKGCWNKIAAENTPYKELLEKVVLPLAIVSAFLMVVTVSIFGISAGNLGVLHPGAGALLSMFLVKVLVSVFRVHVSAFVLHKIAPKFGGTSRFDSVFALVVYSSVPGLLAGIVAMHPLFGLPLSSVLALFELYLLYCGVPTMVQIPTEEQVSFLGYALVIFFLLWLFASLLFEAVLPTAASHIAP